MNKLIFQISDVWVVMMKCKLDGNKVVVLMILMIRMSQATPSAIPPSHYHESIQSMLSSRGYVDEFTFRTRSTGCLKGKFATGSGNRQDFEVYPVSCCQTSRDCEVQQRAQHYFSLDTWLHWVVCMCAK